jgi:hypothetical protein
MIENIIVSFIVTLLAGFPLSIYAGAIVARYYSFEAAIGRARTIILNLDHQWVFAYLPEKISDPNSPTGKRSIYTSEALSGNHVFWQLMQVGLDLKEQGHWPAAAIVDKVAMELDGIREEVVEKSSLAFNESSFDATAHIADWHRRLSKARPITWLMLKPWSSKRYEHMSCISVDESTGEWHEEVPEKR